MKQWSNLFVAVIYSVMKSGKFLSYRSFITPFLLSHPHIYSVPFFFFFFAFFSLSFLLTEIVLSHWSHLFVAVIYGVMQSWTSVSYRSFITAFLPSRPHIRSVYFILCIFYFFWGGSFHFLLFFPFSFFSFSCSLLCLFASSFFFFLFNSSWPPASSYTRHFFLSSAGLHD